MAMNRSNIIPLRNKAAPAKAARGASVDDLTREYGQGLRRYLLRLTCNSDDADDIAQEVFCRVLQNADFARMHNPGAFIFKSAHNLFIDRYRKQQLEQNLADEQSNTVDPENEGESFLQYQEMALAYQHALQELPDRCRQVFLLRRHDGLSNAEIAETLHISMRMVQKHMIKALAHFQKRLHR